MSGPQDEADREPGTAGPPGAEQVAGVTPTTAPPETAPEETPESLADVLASIRALVSAETHARVEGRPSSDVILLTPAMRLDGAGEQLAQGIEEAPAPVASPAPILDEESLRTTINAIVREELQGELGERIGRNLRKLIRREIAQMLEEARKA